MTLEKSLWGRLRACTTWDHIVRIENGADKGTPDVNGCHAGIEFWVELKVAEKPKRAATPIRVRHFTKEQRYWLRNRCAAGGRAYMLLQVSHEYLLLRGDIAALLVGTSPLDELQRAAISPGDSLANLARIIKGVSDGRS
jgi:hypothetical protein